MQTFLFKHVANSKIFWFAKKPFVTKYLSRYLTSLEQAHHIFTNPLFKTAHLHHILFKWQLTCWKQVHLNLPKEAGIQKSTSAKTRVKITEQGFLKYQKNAEF